MNYIETVFIVGNGFDLNLGLKTSYGDFMKSKLVENYMEKNSNSLIDHLLNKIKLNSIESKINPLYSGKNWVDIEDELRHYSKEIHESRLLSDEKCRKKQIAQKYSFRLEYTDLCTILKEYLRTENETPVKYTDDSAAYKVLADVCKHEPFYIINFNYTDCVERIMRADFLNEGGYKVKEIIRHIHGSLFSDIVFGIEDGGNIHPDHVFLYKSHNSHQNVHGLTSIFDKARKIVFFGYSLGQTDHSYFDDFFRKQSKEGCPKKQLTFYYYDTTAYDNLVVQLNKLTENRLSKLKQFNKVLFIPTKEKP